MNWYKKLIISQQTKEPSYLDIGHNLNISGDKIDNNLTSNYMWVYHNGEILVQEENKKNPNHADTKEFSDINFIKAYSGRFETSTGKISIAKPSTGVLKFRDIPNFIINKLYEKFPIKELLYF